MREFVHEHASSSPYFLEISQEFLTFLAERTGNELPDFLLELCHYEWVELILSVSEKELPTEGVDPGGNLESETIVLSPLIWKLSYRYPVHQLGPTFQPEEAPESKIIDLMEALKASVDGKGVAKAGAKAGAKGKAAAKKPARRAAAKSGAAKGSGKAAGAGKRKAR